MNPRRYLTLDVFTNRRFGGNPLAVVLDSEGLSDSEMQTLAAEFNYSETTFVHPAQDSSNDACIRIFTPTEEMPFAGHPNVGTAWALASATEGKRKPSQLRFEEKAGLVVVQLSWDGSKLTQAEVAAPCSLETGPALSVETIADCLGCPANQISNSTHPPINASVGAHFVFAELLPKTLSKLNPSDEAFHKYSDQGVCNGLFAYERLTHNTLNARMFWSSGGIREDPATGSASAALGALIASKQNDATLELTITQGQEMGRPSLISVRAERQSDKSIRAWVAGTAVEVMQGTLTI